MKFEKLARRYAPTFNHILDDELHIRPLALSTPKILITVSREERRSSARKPITPVGHHLAAAASVADAISIHRPKCLGEAFYCCSAFLEVSMRLAENILGASARSRVEADGASVHFGSCIGTGRQSTTFRS